MFIMRKDVRDLGDAANVAVSRSCLVKWLENIYIQPKKQARLASLSKTVCQSVNFYLLPSLLYKLHFARLQSCLLFIMTP